MQKIYNYHPETKALLGAAWADESPLDLGGFIVPAFATLIIPPEVPAGKYAAFNGTDWLLLDDVGPVAETIEETPAQTIARYEAALDHWMDAKARMYRYDNRFTFALRAAYPGPWHNEGVAFAEWMDTCNQQAFDLLVAVQAGQAELPSIEAFIEGLPVLVLPAPVV